MKKEKRDAQIHVRTTQELKRKGEEAAAAEARTLSSLMEVLLMEHLASLGRS